MLSLLCSEEKRCNHPKTQNELEPGDLIARSGIRIPHLKLIVALDDHGQISSAATHLNMSQPAASRMLTEIESILDAPLCDRLPRGIELDAVWRGICQPCPLPSSWS